MAVPLMLALAGFGLAVMLKLRSRVPGSGLPAGAESASLTEEDNDPDRWPTTLLGRLRRVLGGD